MKPELNPGFEAIEPPADPAQRRVGWLLLTFLSPGFGYVGWSAVLSLSQGVNFSVLNTFAIVFYSALLVMALGLGIVAVRMALETRKWIVGPGYFERRSDILGFSWSKVQQFEGWSLESYFCDVYTSYLLNPIGEKQISLVAFYRTNDAQLSLKLGRQLANITGWPLRLSDDLARLEKEISP